MKLVTVFEKPELDQLQTAVIVEMWKRVMTTGSGKRKLAAAFPSEGELDRVKKVYDLARWWYGKGTPEEHRCTLDEFEFIKRVCNFFGTY